MIKYALICDNDHEFESWFQNSQTFDDQLASGNLVCPHCASSKVSKSIMAPNLGKKSNTSGTLTDQNKSAEITQMMSRMREHVENNFDYVGEKFASEARAMHYGDSEERDIFQCWITNNRTTNEKRHEDLKDTFKEIIRRETNQ